MTLKTLEVKIDELIIKLDEYNEHQRRQFWEKIDREAYLKNG